MTAPRVVLDTNVVVSALLFRGAASKLYDAWCQGRVRLVVSQEILLEYARVLAYPKFGLSELEVVALLGDEVVPYADLVDVSEGERLCVDPDDNKFLWCAATSAADALVTGDHDLLQVAPTQQVPRILTIAEFRGLLLREDG